MKDLPPLPELADKLGFSATAVYATLYELYRKQRRRQGHSHDGRYWVRMPYKDFPRMFPELPEATVLDALKRLEDKGLIRMVHHGRLSWYTIIKTKRRVV